MTETHYGLATFNDLDGRPRAGLAIGERVAALDDLAAKLAVRDPKMFSGRSVLDLLMSWDAILPALDDLFAARANAADMFRPFAAVTIRPPVDLPRQIFCTGANYRTHVIHLMVDMGLGPEGLDRDERRRFAEHLMDERAATGTPYAFSKPISAIAGPNDDLVVPPLEDKPDWELELGVVIGRGGYRISRASAMDHVAGYAIVNDVTCRTLIPRTDDRQLGLDWLRSKGQPGFLPFGPVMVPAKFIPDPHRLRISLSLNGETMQDEDTSDMIFDISRQIEHISRYVRLLPGDLICTGSPAGNGTHYNRFLQPGDVMVGEITSLGRQTIRCIADES